MKILKGNWVIQGYCLAIGAAMSYGGSQVVAKLIVGDIPPLVGAAFALLFGTLILGVLTARDVVRPNNAPLRSYLWMATAGLVASSGVAAMFVALSKAPVVVISPLISINPLLAILLSQLFIRKLERFTWRAPAGAFLIVVGVTVISIY
jgi:drug/metabolite transporter (DMT)-like permease